MHDFYSVLKSLRLYLSGRKAMEFQNPVKIAHIQVGLIFLSLYCNTRGDCERPSLNQLTTHLIASPK